MTPVTMIQSSKILLSTQLLYDSSIATKAEARGDADARAVIRASATTLYFLSDLMISSSLTNPFSVVANRQYRRLDTSYADDASAAHDDPFSAATPCFGLACLQ